MSYALAPVGMWRKGDKTPWYLVTEDPMVIDDVNVAEYNLPGRGVLPGEVMVRVQYVTDGGREIRIFPNVDHHVKTESPTVAEKQAGLGSVDEMMGGQPPAKSEGQQASDAAAAEDPES